MSKKQIDWYVDDFGKSRQPIVTRGNVSEFNYDDGSWIKLNNKTGKISYDLKNADIHIDNKNKKIKLIINLRIGLETHSTATIENYRFYERFFDGIVDLIEDAFDEAITWAITAFILTFVVSFFIQGGKINIIPEIITVLIAIILAAAAYKIKDDILF